MDFSKPQRQSPVGIVILFMDTTRKYIRAFWPILIILFIKVDSQAGTSYLFGGGAVFLILALAAYLSYRNFTFYIDTELDEFILTSGVLSKTRTAIKLSKIQQVNINQSFVQRLVGVYELDFDTAGSAGKEVTIKALSHTLALALKEHVLEHRTSSTPTAEDIPHNETDAVLQISLGSLIKTGLTSNYVRTLGLMVAFFFTILDNINHIGTANSNYEIERYVNEKIIMQSIVFLIFLLLLAVLLVNLLRVIIKYYNYTIIRNKNTLHVSFGLLNTKSAILRPQRVQIVTVIQNYFQKKMNMATVKIAQAGGEHQMHKQSLEIPSCSGEEKDMVLHILLDKLPESTVQLAANYRKLVFGFFLGIVVPLGTFLWLKSSINMGNESTILAVLYTVFVSLLLFFNFKNSRLYLSNNLLMVRYGSWDVTTKIIQAHKIQSVVTSQLFWHKPLDIGNLTVHTAGGSVTFSLGKFSEMVRYVNLWIYQIESSNQDWM